MVRTGDILLKKYLFLSFRYRGKLSPDAVMADICWCAKSMFQGYEKSSSDSDTDEDTDEEEEGDEDNYDDFFDDSDEEVDEDKTGDDEMNDDAMDEHDTDESVMSTSSTGGPDSKKTRSN